MISNEKMVIFPSQNPGVVEHTLIPVLRTEMFLDFCEFKAILIQIMRV